MFFEKEKCQKIEPGRRKTKLKFSYNDIKIVNKTFQHELTLSLHNFFFKLF